MHPQTYSPGLTAATTTARALIAAGWQYDSTSPMADDTTIRTLLHPSGREIHARTVDRDGDDTTSLTMTGLSLEQVAGVITGAGLAPPPVEPSPDTDPRRHAYNLVVAGVAAGLPLPEGIALNSFGVIEVEVPNNDCAGVDAWSAYLGLPTPTLGEVLTGTARDFRVYKSRVSSHPNVSGWTVEVCAYCDAEGGAR